MCYTKLVEKARTDYETLASVARAQGFKVLERADGHITFTGPRGQIVKMRRAGVEEGTRSWGGTIRRLRRIGLQWPPATWPEREHNLLVPSMGGFPTDLSAAEPTPAEIDDAVRAAQEERKALQMNGTLLQPLPKFDRHGDKDPASSEEIARLSEKLRYLFPPGQSVDEFAEFAGFSRSLIGYVRMRGLTIGYKLSQRAASQLDEAVRRWECGGRLNGHTPSPPSSSPAIEIALAVADAQDEFHSAKSEPTPQPPSIAPTPSRSETAMALADMFDAEVARVRAQFAEQIQDLEAKVAELRALLVEAQSKSAQDAQALAEIRKVLEGGDLTRG